MITAAAPMERAPVRPAPTLLPRGVWVIFREPHCADRFPFVARKFLMGRVFTWPTDDELLAASVADLRKLLPAGLCNIGRHDDDPPNVVEAWV